MDQSDYIAHARSCLSERTVVPVRVRARDDACVADQEEGQTALLEKEQNWIKSKKKTPKHLLSPRGLEDLMGMSPSKDCLATC